MKQVISESQARLSSVLFCSKVTPVLEKFYMIPRVGMIGHNHNLKGCAVFILSKSYSVGMCARVGDGLKTEGHFRTVQSLTFQPHDCINLVEKHGHQLSRLCFHNSVSPLYIIILYMFHILCILLNMNTVFYLAKTGVIVLNGLE